MNKSYINIFFLLVLIFFSPNIYANELENKNRYKISILSIGEGPSLGDAFGHTAIRVKDEELKNDVVSTEIASVNPALGFELGYIDLVYLRLGVGNFQNEIQYDSSEKLSFQPNFGIGFNMNSIEINYAFTDIGNQSTALYSNIFSLKFNLNMLR